MKLIRIVLAVAAGFLATSYVHSADPGIVYGMVVRGHVELASDGSIEDYSLLDAQKIPDEVRSLIGSTIRGWKLEPLQARTAPAMTSDMTAQVVAHQNEAGNFQIRVSAVHFSSDASPEERISFRRFRKPQFPRQAEGASATVYLLLKVDLQGNVQEAIAEQVNLRTAAGAAEAERWRGAFANAATAVARQWNVDLPSGIDQSKPFTAIRVPVGFHSDGVKPEWHPAMYGKWVAHMPGPKVTPPWLKSLSSAPPEMVGGSAALVDDRGSFRILNEPASVTGVIVDKECDSTAKKKRGFWDGAGTTVKEIAAEVIGTKMGQAAGQAAIGGWEARHAGAFGGVAVARRTIDGAPELPTHQQPATGIQCRISVRSGSGVEVNAHYYGPSEPIVGNTARVHRQADGTYSNIYSD